MNGCDVSNGHSFEDFTDVLDYTGFMDVFVELLHSDWDYCCQGGETTHGLQSCNLKMIILFFNQVWKKRDETFHVNGLDTNLFIETVFA